MKHLKLTLLLVVFVLSMSMAPSVLAKDIREWDMVETEDAQKVWNIKFNEELKASKVTTTNIYVKDENNRKFSTTVELSTDKKEVTVTPKKKYEAGKAYKLYLDDDIYSESGKKLKEMIVFPFTILGEEVPEEETLK